MQHRRLLIKKNHCAKAFLLGGHLFSLKLIEEHHFSLQEYEVTILLSLKIPRFNKIDSISLPYKIDYLKDLRKEASKLVDFCFGVN